MITWKFRTADEKFEDAKVERDLGIGAFDLLSRYSGDINICLATFGKQSVTVYLEPINPGHDKLTPEQCWDFINWLEDELGVNFETNRPKIDSYYDSTFEYTMVDKFGIRWTVRNCFEYCHVEFTEEHQSETRRTPKIVCDSTGTEVRL